MLMEDPALVCSNSFLWCLEILHETHHERFLDLYWLLQRHARGTDVQIKLRHDGKLKLTYPGSAPSVPVTALLTPMSAAINAPGDPLRRAIRNCKSRDSLAAELDAIMSERSQGLPDLFEVAFQMLMENPFLVRSSSFFWCLEILHETHTKRFLKLLSLLRRAHYPPAGVGQPPPTTSHFLYR